MVFVFLGQNYLQSLIYVFVTNAEDNSDFNDFDNDLSTSVDNLKFKKSVTKGNELVCDGCDEDDYAVVVHKEDHDVDDLECPLSELI